MEMSKQIDMAIVKSVDLLQQASSFDSQSKVQEMNKETLDLKEMNQIGLLRAQISLQEFQSEFRAKIGNPQTS